MTVKKKYYVVWQGYTPGIYPSWDECNAQVKSYPGAKYKAFASLDAAKAAFAKGWQTNKALAKSAARATLWEEEFPPGSIIVDAACSGNPGSLEYQGLDFYTGQRIFHKGPFANGTNNIGEFLAIVHGLAYLQQKNDQVAAVISDSKIAIQWVRQKKCKTQLTFDERNRDLKQLIDRATYWLSQNPIRNPILLWETKKWGENPADFGRK